MRPALGPRPWALAVYRLLLWLFPPAFRERFGADMTDLFADRAAEARRRGRAAAAQFWIMTTLDVARHGLAERRAHRAARRLSVGRVGARPRRARGDGPMRDLVQDVRFALRLFNRQRGFTITAVLTLALGIGVNVAVFSVIDGVLLRWLPISHADRVVRVSETADRDHAQPWNAANFVDVHRMTTGVFEALAAYRGTSSPALSAATGAVTVRAAAVTPAFFQVLGVAPLFGRPLTPADVDANAHVIVVSADFWRSKLVGDPAAIGRPVELDGQPWTVVGVLPKGIVFPENTQIWKPLVFPPEELLHRNSWSLEAIGRLAPGVTLAQANAALEDAMAEVSRVSPGPSGPRGAEAVDLRGDTIKGVRLSVWFVQGVAVLILLIACANLANLLMASATAREHEFSVRAAIGAGRGRLARQVLVESLTLSAAGGALGAALAYAIVPLLVNAYPGVLPGRERIAVGGVELAVALTGAVGTAVLFGLAPAWLGSRANVTGGLRATERAGTPKSTRLLRSGLVVAEAALTLSLLAGAALLIKSFATLTMQPIGFDPSNVLTARLTLPAARYHEDAQRGAFEAGLLDRLNQRPEIAAAAAAMPLPFDRSGIGSVFLGEGPDGKRLMLVVEIAYVSPGYPQALGVPLLDGRFIATSDAAEHPLVAVANASFARKYGQGGSAVGVRFRRTAATPWITVVGTVADVRADFRQPVRPQLLFPLAQGSVGSFTLAARTRMAPDRFAPELRALVRDLDPSLPLTNVATMSTVIGDSVDEQRFDMGLLVSLAALAMVLAAVGIYGVMAYVVGQRTREMGIRLALGAQPGQVQSLVVRQGLVPIVIGVAGGLGGAWYLTSLLKKELFEVRPHDPWTLAAAAVGFLLVGLAACWLPARRTGRVDPVSVLRVE